MNLRRLVKEELSSSVAKSYVAQLCRFHRIQGSTMFHEAAEYVKSELVKRGFEDAAVEQFPADGESKYWTYTSPMGWSVNSAELRLLEPEDKLLCTYEDCAQSLHTYSNATPGEGVTAELIDVGKGTKSKDYDGKNVAGKFVLATGRGFLVHPQAVYKHGAVGVITDTPMEMPNVREGLDIPDAHAYHAIWPKAEDLARVKFGFSISKRQGNALRALLQAGKTVKLRARVDAKLFPFHEDVVTATIRGTQKPDEEIFMVAHLCHPKPSANDNASGSGLLLEIARTMKALVMSNRIPSPARTIRFIWVPETLGSVAYISNHAELASRLVAGINLDMVGQDQSLCKSALNLDRTPDSCPSYLNDFIFGLMEETVKEFDTETLFGPSSTFRYRSTAFSGGSDHAEFTEATTRVPCVMLLQWPDLYYHTSMDTIDKVSEDSLKRVGWITAVAALTLANADGTDILVLAHETAQKGSSRIAQASIDAVKTLKNMTQQPRFQRDKTSLAAEIAKTAAYYRSKIDHVMWREQQAIRSVNRLGNHLDLAPSIEKYCQEIRSQGAREKQILDEALALIASMTGMPLPEKLEETRSEQQLRGLVPSRFFKGSLSADRLRESLGEDEYEWYEKIDEVDIDFYKKRLEAVNFMDGTRTAYDILVAISAEYSPTEPEHLLRFLSDLEKSKLIVFQPAKQS